MAKRRKRRSSADLTARAMRDIRNMHREHLREISVILSNVLGFHVKVTPVRAPEVPQVPKTVRRKARAKVTRQVAHQAGYGDDQAPAEVPAQGNPPDDGVGF